MVVTVIVVDIGNFNARKVVKALLSAYNDLTVEMIELKSLLQLGGAKPCDLESRLNKER